MPWDKIIELYNNLHETAKEFGNTIGKIDDMGVIDNDRTMYDMVQHLDNTMLPVKMITEEMLEKKEPLSPQDAKLTQAFYQAFFKEIDAFLAQPDIFIPVDVLDFCEDYKLNESAFKQHEAALGKIASGETPDVTMEQLMSDYTWAEDIFAEDPLTAQNRNAAPGNWDVSQHSVKENLNRYIETVNGLGSSYNKHLKTLTGENYAPDTVFYNKLILLQEAIEKATKKDAPSPDVMRFKRINESIHRDFDAESIESLASDSIPSERYFVNVLGTEYNFAGAKKTMSENMADPANCGHFEKALSKLSLDPANLGINLANYQAIRDIASLICLPDDFIKDITESAGRDPLANRDINDPIFYAANKASMMSSEMLKYIQTGDESRLPDEYVFADFCDALARVASKGLFKEDGSIDKSIFTGNEYLQKTMKFFPQMSDRFTTYTQDFFDTHIEDEIKKVIDSFAKTAGGTEAFINNWTKIENAHDAHLVNDADYFKADVYRLSKDVNYMNQTLQSGTDPRKILLAAAFKKEYEAGEKYLASTRGPKNLIMGPYNLAVVKGPYPDADITADDLTKLNDYITKVLGSPVGRELIEKNPKDLRNFLNSPLTDVDVLIYGNTKFRSFTEANISALTQTSGNLYSNNSESYVNVGEALMGITREAHNPGGPSVQAVENLYNACKNYMYLHDSVPGSPNGKLRFNATAAVFAETANRLKAMKPEMAADINKEIKLEMIRSKSFRDECSKLSPELKAQADRIGTVLNETIRKPQITGKLNTAELPEAVLGRFSQIEAQYNQAHPQRQAAQQPKKAGPVI